MSEFHVEVIRVGPVSKHPNADTLSMTTAHGGYPVLFKSGTYKEGDLAVYIPVDAIVPDTAEWSWLAPAGAALRDKDRRIKAKRLRGIFSMGLLTDAPPGTKVGQDVTELLGITKHDPDAAEERAPSKPKPPRNIPWWRAVMWWIRFWFFKPEGWTKPIAPPKLRFTPGVYDIEPFRRYGQHWFEEGEIVVVTEKIHGQNASFVHDGKCLHVKSRTRWRRNDPTESQNTWAKVAAKYDLESKLAAHPGIILFGETYGNNSDMPYGVDRAKDGDSFMVFDAYNSNTGQWLNWVDLITLCTKFLGVPMVPLLREGVWSQHFHDKLLDGEAEGPSVVRGAKHLREGFVIKPVLERRVNGRQRVILKMAGEGYLTRKAA